MKGFQRKLLTVGLTSVMGLAALPTMGMAATQQAVAQGVGSAVLQNADYFGGVDPSTPVTVDIVMKLQHQDQLAQYINNTVTPGSHGYRNYLSVSAFNKQYAPDVKEIRDITDYLASYGIQSKVYPDNLIITANGTAGQFNQAFNVVLQNASYNGKKFHAPKGTPKVPAKIGNDILCVLGLSDYSNLQSNAIKQPGPLTEGDSTPVGPLSLNPSDLINQYHVQPLYDKGAAGAGETIGIVTLAGINTDDAYAFWANQNIAVKSDRLQVTNIDGDSPDSNPNYYNGYDETSLDVEQSGALAPQANIHVYVGPNTDTGFVDAFAQAINDNVAHQISVSWGESETAVNLFVQAQMETPEYMNAFNQLYMEAAAQGISMFAAAGDEGAYDAAREFGLTSGLPGAASLSVDTPADSPYITAAGGTTLPFHFHSNAYNYDVANDQERAWGWDFLYGYFDARGLNNPGGWAGRYLAGGGGGFSQMYATPDYQQGVAGVNTYTAVKQWTPNADQSTLTRDASPTIVTGTGTGRNLPDLSMNADPYTGYNVYFSDPGAPGSNAGYAVYGGTSFVSPQLCGLSALINSADHTQVGFWNPQIYRFASQSNSPLHPLNAVNTSGNVATGNDNGFYTGTPGTVYNQATGLGTPDVSALADSFAAVGKSH